MVHSIECRLYVACLASYNSGRLHGLWIDVSDDADEMRSEIAAMLRASPYPNVEVECPDCEGAGCDVCKNTGKVPSAEEYAVHDCEGFDGWKLGEHPDLDEVAEVYKAAEEHGPAVFAYMGNNCGGVSGFEEAYRGEYKDVEEYAYQLVDDLGIITKDTPDILSRYFDYAAFARDLELGGDIWTADAPGGVYIFDNH